MGAAEFHDTSQKKDVAEAFNECREQAWYDHGHSGYSGTIAEKDGYRVFELPLGRTVEDVLRTCGEFYRHEDVASRAWLPIGLFEIYDDKWGPAVAMRDHDGAWHFFGWASE